jgi:hypothetical protein
MPVAEAKWLVRSHHVFLFQPSPDFCRSDAAINPAAITLALVLSLGAIGEQGQKAVRCGQTGTGGLAERSREEEPHHGKEWSGMGY